MILGLQNEEGIIQTETRKMIETASNYHKQRQEKPQMNMTRRRTIFKMKKNIKEKLHYVEVAELTAKPSTEEVREAIRQTQTGKCPGHSGITYEFWKSWKEPKKNSEGNNDKKPISISSILQSVFSNIERHGIEDEAYTKGIMSFIFKKKDKMKIENYRPITLLETDYKIHTKTVANKLGRVCQNLIHKDQAGFIPGRSLFDHTRLGHLVVDYAEKQGQNGCIISLDQEKAYDKIDHEYLWEILEEFRFPREFIELIKTMYSKAKTSVMINGVSPAPIKVERGVQQTQWNKNNKPCKVNHQAICR